MHAPITALADILDSHEVPVSMYRFEHASAHTQQDWWGTYHSLELDAVFGSPFTGFNLAVDNYTSDSETDRDVSRLVMHCWTTFAKHGYAMQLTFRYIRTLC